MIRDRRDWALVAIPAVELALAVAGVVEYANLARWQLWAMGAFLVFLNCTSFQCVSHYFIHQPFFKSRRLNQAFSLFMTLPLGVPQSLYKAHHLNHHRYGNDVPDSATGRTADRTSTYRHASERGMHESLWAYSLLGPLRTEFGFLFSQARRLGLLRLAISETCLLVLFFALLIFLSAKAALLFYLPVWYFGEVAAFAENYLEHFGAHPGSRLTDSVSSYGNFYNWIWFNNGYHQEHHYKPLAHWTELPALRASMKPESERKVIPGAHWFSLEAWTGSRSAIKLTPHELAK